jgi:hypothetical protein
MTDPLVSYFSAEKSEATLFMAVGLVALGVALYLWLAKSAWKAMAFPLVAIAAIQIIVGATVFFRTAEQVATLQEQYTSSRAAFVAEETTRMHVVVKNFKAYKAIEIALLALGLALAVFLRRNGTWRAIGVGLVVQSSLMLVLDLFAERRADEYLRFVTGAS